MKNRQLELLFRLFRLYIEGNSSHMNEIIKNITKTDQKIALSSIQSLIKNEEVNEKSNPKTIRLKVNDSNDEIVIPSKAF